MKRWLPGALGIAVFGACGGTGLEDPAALWCDGLCSAERRCNKTRQSQEVCRSECVDARPGLSGYSREGAEAWRPCLAGLECRALSDEVLWDEALDACWDQAWPTLEPRQTARDFCVRHAAEVFECGYWFAVQDCERVYSMYTDSLIRRLDRCMPASSCEEHEACIERAFLGR